MTKHSHGHYISAWIKAWISFSVTSSKLDNKLKQNVAEKREETHHKILEREARLTIEAHQNNHLMSVDH